MVFRGNAPLEGKALESDRWNLRKNYHPGYWNVLSLSSPVNGSCCSLSLLSVKWVKGRSARCWQQTRLKRELFYLIRPGLLNNLVSMDGWKDRQIEESWERPGDKFKVTQPFIQSVQHWGALEEMRSQGALEHTQERILYASFNSYQKIQNHSSHKCLNRCFITQLWLVLYLLIK